MTASVRASLARHSVLASVLGCVALASGAAVRLNTPEQYRAHAILFTGGAAQSVARLAQSSRIVDSAVKHDRLYLVPGRNAGFGMFHEFSLGDRFLPGNYTLEVRDGSTGWILTPLYAYVSDTGVVSDSVGRRFGFHWRVDRARFALLAGKTVEFTVMTPREVEREISERLTATPLKGGQFLALELMDEDATRAAQRLNAVSAELASIARSGGLHDVAVLDSAVAPSHPDRTPAVTFWLATLLAVAVAAVGIPLLLDSRSSRWNESGHADLTEA